MEVKEPSAKYLAKAGYKQTEVGVIPEDWESVQIGEFDPFITSGSRGWAAYYSEYGSPFIRITNLSRTCIYPDLGDLRCVDVADDSSEAARTQLQNGDVLISITADIGIIGYVTDDLPKPAYINQHISLVRFDSDLLDSKFIAYFLASENSQRAFRALTDAGAKAGMNLTTVQQTRVVLPPTKVEQAAIAEVLSDADALIESLEQLLAKKCHLKQGAMQELLTGKKRLPGFSGEWVLRTLDSVVEALDAGVSVNSLDSLPHTGEPSILKTSAMADGRFLPIECKAIAPFDISRARTNPRRDTILISRMNTPDLVGEIGYVDDDYSWLFLPDRIWMTRFRLGSEICVRWLAYLLSSAEYKRLIQGAATGTSGSMKNISKPGLMALPIRFPSYSEQTAIASTLSDIDAEIAELESQLAKTRALKQGMMQKLLTGEIRLV